MTIDINLLREEKSGVEAVALVRKSQESRGGAEGVKLVDKVIELDKEWRKAAFDVDEVNKRINKTQAEITKAFKAKEDAKAKLAEKADLEKEKAALIARRSQMEKELNDSLNGIGNIVHDSVIVSNDEENNAIIRKWSPDGNEPTQSKGLAHRDLLERLGAFDGERGIKVAGHRGYFLRGVGVDFALAMASYGLAFLSKRDYTKIMTPVLMNKSMMAATAQLSQFDEELYKAVDTTNEENSKYLIATSEQPISAFHADEWINDVDLPLKYAGYSSCFRKEAGAHGKDTGSLFRVHQFEKVEQFVLCRPEESWKLFHEMIETSEAFYQSLELPYRIVSIVSGALNNAAAMKYDLEAWFPVQGQYKELVSCSNCTDYQSRNLKIRCGTKTDDSNFQFVHLLNATLTAIQRTICCILETWQTEDGITVPPPLRPYIGKDFIPFLPAKKEGDGAADISKKMKSDLKI